MNEEATCLKLCTTTTILRNASFKSVDALEQQHPGELLILHDNNTPERYYQPH